MPCYDFEVPGGRGIACVRGASPRRRRCTGCGQLGADRLCDVPIGGQARGRKRRATCSAPVCADCSVRIGDDDVCPLHPVPDEALTTARAPVEA
jgi:hypothetical protein